MTYSKKTLLFSTLFIGGGSIGTYFLWPGSNLDQVNREETEVPILESVVPQEENIAPVDTTIPLEISESEENKAVPIQESVVEGDVVVEPIANRFWSEGRKRKIGLDVAKSNIEVIRDYTIRVGPATGWFLDYVLPETPGKYPTKWFIATNAHVVANTYFDQSNPYDQILPRQGGSPNESVITLVKEKVRHDDVDFDQSRWDHGKTYVEYEHWNVENKKQRENHDLYYQLSFDAKKPKLFYFPYQYLGTESWKWPSNNFSNHNYSSDFVVMEVDFKDEWIAKFMTRNFYNKYDSEVGTHKEKALNFFARPIAEQYSNREIYEKDLHVFTAGYPTSGLQFKSTSNYNSAREEAARLSYVDRWNYWGVPIQGGDYLLGHSNMSEWNLQFAAMLEWNGKPFLERGYHYYVEDHYQGAIGGSSGSLNVLENGEVLGLSSRGGSARNGAVRSIAPLRNKEIKGLDGKVLFPAYDLLEGVEGQQNSYRDQIKKYFLENGQETALSRLRKWSSK